MIKKNIVIFDFDKTLSAGDAPVEFGKYCFRHSLRPWLFLPIIAAGFVVKFIACEDKKYRVRKIDILWRQMTRRFTGSAMIKKFIPGFVAEHKMNRFGWAKEQVEKERSSGNFVILSSATPDYIVLPLVSDIEFDLIITSEMDKKRPWKYKFLNWGYNKAIALERIVAGRKVVRAYSDNISDSPMMNLAREKVWIDPKTGCRI
ncbi:MAG: haloacid dehalogenase-like hydrolase [Alphaproteobacteria bacterium]|nr:haloacid dehalogenase-like hydrolase [Alphaproteobacteria bacterium]